MKLLKKLFILLPFVIFMAVTNLQSGLCDCAQKDEACDNGGMKCCAIDPETKKPLECRMDGMAIPSEDASTVGLCEAVEEAEG